MFFVTVGAGEIIVCGIIGMILLYALTPVRYFVFSDAGIIRTTIYDFYAVKGRRTT